MKRLLPVLTCAVLAFSFQSCILVSLLDIDINPNNDVNDWIYDKMDTYYYWTDKLPSKSDKTLAPDAYFESLLYKYNAVTAQDGDRFSWIQDNYEDLLSSLNGVSSNEIGFDYMLYLKQKGSSEVVGIVTYAKKGTSAELIGIKRGMMFDQVNGVSLTTSNYQSLLSATASQITFGFVEGRYVSDSLVISREKDLTVQTISQYSENPVYLDSVYTYPGHKVGYLVYNFFAADGGTNDAAYDLELNRVFGKFKTEDITDLVLDLRYNSGGISTSAELLASLIVPNLNKSKVYSYYEYNSFLNDYFMKKNGADYFNSYFTESVMNEDLILEKVNNVGDHLGSKVVILTGPYTASASEQVINGLKPYMNQVILIGDTTFGKNVASISIYEKNDSKNKWGMQPIIAKYFNQKGESDFTAGFIPDYQEIDLSVQEIKPLGDVNETLLNKALNVLGIINTPTSALKRSGTMQNSKLLRSPSHIQRGLQLNKMLLFE